MMSRVYPAPWHTLPECLEIIEKLLPDADLQGREILLDYRTSLREMKRQFVCPMDPF